MTNNQTFSLDDLFILNETTPTFLRCTFPNKFEYVQYRATKEGLYRIYNDTVTYPYDIEYVQHGSRMVVKVRKEKNLNYDLFVPTELIRNAYDPKFCVRNSPPQANPPQVRHRDNDDDTDHRDRPAGCKNQ